jgi:anhydro-N-acetylmuramic acid kinase
MLCIGLMSGTSMDGVDGVLLDLNRTRSTGITVCHHVHLPMPEGLREQFMLLQTSGQHELHRAALAANALSRLYANVVDALLRESGCTAKDVSCIGAHGQTVRHQPGLHDGTGYTVQVNNPALLAELTGIDVVADFRVRDVAAGGQGAPLVPAFHQEVFGQSDACVAVLNIGGISNLSVLEPGHSPKGWDCGPGNALLDHWCHMHTGQAFDEDGHWAATGQIHEALLAHLLDESYLKQPPPKSTGRDLFNPEWLDEKLGPFRTLAAHDVQATLTAFTAKVCARDVSSHAPHAHQLIVCGGGALNKELMRLLQAGLGPGTQLVSSISCGIHPLQVEASAFAWLAFKCIERETSSLPSVTGAKGARVLGAIYPG